MPTVTSVNLAGVDLARLGAPDTRLSAIPPGATAANLVNLLNAEMPKILSGTRPQITAQEGAWLVKLAQHPNADASVRSAITNAVAGRQLSRSAKAAGLENFFANLRATGGDTLSTTTTPTTTTGGGNGLSTPVTGPTATAGGIATGAVDPNTMATPVRPLNPCRAKGDVTFEGPVRLTAAGLQKYGLTEPQKFGTTDVELPTGGTNNVRDMHYDLGNGKIGMRLMPVSDRGSMTTPDGQSVPGSKLMDDFLRKEMGLGAGDPIFAIIAYVHPEKHSGKISDLGTNALKTEMGATHMGAYVGGGRTTNSPQGYHNNEWEVSGYPANVIQVSLEGVPQKTLNTNAIIADSLLNNGVRFPPDYKKDVYRTVDLATTLKFYKDWIQDAAYLRNDATWHTYCAEHKTIVTNVMLNVPHNEAAFKEIWGDADGAKLWADCKAKYKSVSGKDLVETNFEPLWKKEGVTNPTAEAMPGKALAWPPETNADIVNDFVETYASFRDVGGVPAGSVIFGFKDAIVDRMGLSEQEFFGLALPVVNKMMIADAMSTAAGNPAMLQGWLQKSTAMMYCALGGKQTDLAPGGTPNPALMQLAEQCFAGVKAEMAKLATQAPVSKDQAWDWLQGAMAADLDKARKMAVRDPNRNVQYYSPPAVAHRVAIGIHESSKFVTVKTLCTAMDVDEVKFT